MKFVRLMFAILFVSVLMLTVMPAILLGAGFTMVGALIVMEARCPRTISNRNTV